MTRYSRKVEKRTQIPPQALFMAGKHCACCGSQDMLELDRVNPLKYPPTDIWSWSEWDRDKFIKDECQVLCHECYMRKKNLWKKYAEENAFWYQEFKGVDNAAVRD